MSFPPGHSINDSIDKDKYLGTAIDLAYPTINSFATMVKAVGQGALMYKRDLCRAYCQIWTDPFNVPYQGFFWQGAFYFDTVLVWGALPVPTSASKSPQPWSTSTILEGSSAPITLMISLG